MTHPPAVEIVVSNTTPIISAWAGGFIAHLPKIFFRMHVPVEEVAEWLAVSARKSRAYPHLQALPLLADVIEEWSARDFLIQHSLPLPDREQGARINEALRHPINTPDGLALVLASRLHKSQAADAFLADEAGLRKMAGDLSIPVVGTLFCLRRMHEENLVTETEAHECMRRAIKCGQRYSVSLVQSAFPSFQM